MIQYDIIKRPVITEKTSIQKEDANQITFEVDRRANRIEIRRAIENDFQGQSCQCAYHASQG